MEKIKEATKLIENAEHLFYCDDCGVFLGTTVEFDDGWCPKLGRFTLIIPIYDQRYEIKKCLCDECKEKFITRLTNMLIDIGFQK